MHMQSFYYSYFILHSLDRSACEAAHGDQGSDGDSITRISAFTRDNNNKALYLLRVGIQLKKAKQIFATRAIFNS